MKVGILGAGQLSRMLALAGIPMGIEFVFYSPVHTDCVTHLGELHTGTYDDNAALTQFANCVDVITYENENIPLDVLDHLALQNKTIHPGINAIKIMQDRALEKAFFEELNIPTACYHLLDHKVALPALINQLTFPLVVKKRKNGYDGKGQVVVRDRCELENLFEAQLSETIIEEFIAFDREISSIAARDSQGNIVFYDICQNTHTNGILIKTINKPDDPHTQIAREYLARVMNTLDYVGTCTLEFFVTKKGLIANELAPRVHNTGHWTIEGANTSQFENHLRCLLNLPLGEAASYGQFIMYNLLGKLPDKTKILAYNTLHFHDYIKSEKPNRKIGHLTLLYDEAIARQVETDLLNIRR